ncbi:MAG TPA: hypothetical protein VIK86_05605 [Candidatus Paceibacterota bacterium]
MIKLDGFEIYNKAVQSFQSEKDFIAYASKICYFDLPEKEKVAKLKVIYKIANSEKPKK